LDTFRIFVVARARGRFDRRGRAGTRAADHAATNTSSTNTGNINTGNINTGSTDTSTHHVPGA
jgi:hypothetical protein